MGTTLVYSAALLLIAAIATGTNDTISTITATTSTITSASKLTSATESSVAPKLKRGVVEIGTNIWANNGGYQARSATPNTNSATVSQNSGSHNPQNSVSRSSAYSPAHNDGRTSSYNNQNSGYQHASPYSSLSHANVDESYGNTGETYEATGPSYGSASQSYVSSPQNYASLIQGQNSGFTSLYSPQSQTSVTQVSPNFGGFHDIQAATSSAQTQNSQGGQIQNGAISTPYYATFANAPSSVKIFTDKNPTGQYKASPVRVSYEQQNVHKAQTMYAPNHQSSSYIIPSANSFPYQQLTGLSRGLPYTSQGGPVFSATAQVHRNALKANFPEQKNPAFTQMYAPHHQSASSFVPSVQSTGFSPATVEFNGKKIPLPVLQLQSAEDFPGFSQAFRTQPLVLEANSPFQAQPEFTFLNDFAKSLTPQAGNILPFLNSQPSNQLQVLPVRSANGTPQFPQYKGASINTSPNHNQGKPAGVYEHLNAQPQLHFTGKPALLSRPSPSVPTSTSSIIHYPSLRTRPAAEIRDDAEVINKKKRPTPPQRDYDDDDLDEGYKAIEKEYGRHQDEDDEGSPRGKHFKESDAESDFKPSRSFPFKSYDEKFSKYSSPSSDDDSDEDRPASRYRHSSSAEDDDDYDGHSTTHHADYRSPKARPSRYEDAAEESRRHESQDESEEDEEHERRPSAYKSYGKDFEQEFEDSYKRELPKTKYVHIKEVPEIDEPAAPSQKSYSSSDSSPKSSKYNYKERKGYHQSHDEEPEESKSYGSHTSQKYGKVPKNRDSDGYSSTIQSYNKGQSPRVVHEESFGYKTPDADGYSKYKKSPSGDSYSSVKKSPKMDSYSKASRSSYKSPKKDNAYENGDSYSYSSGSSWKSDKKTPEKSDYHGHATRAVKTLALPDSMSSFNAPAIGRGNFFYSRNEKMVRDLTGI